MQCWPWRIRCSGIWKKGSIHCTLLTGCSKVQCKLPLSITGMGHSLLMKIKQEVFRVGGRVWEWNHFIALAAPLLFHIQPPNRWMTMEGKLQPMVYAVRYVFVELNIEGRPSMAAKHSIALGTEQISSKALWPPLPSSVALRRSYTSTPSTEKWGGWILWPLSFHFVPAFCNCSSQFSVEWKVLDS